MKRAVVAVLAWGVIAPALAHEGTFHGDVTRSGVYASAGPKQFGGVKWTLKTGGPIVGSPVVADQEVLFAPVFGDFEDMYVATFKFASIGAIVSSPAVDGGVVFAASMDGNLYALK